MRKLIVVLTAAAPALALAQLKPPLLITEVSISPTHVAFGWAGQIWEVSRSGGTARQLFKTDDVYRSPRYSRDGSQLAFLKTDAGEFNLYVMPARGGEPRQLTFHPKFDIPWDFSPDGKTILFSSDREFDGNELLMEFRLGEVMERRVAVPTGAMGSFSPDGRMVAYVPRPAFGGMITRRFYRGGWRSRIEVLDRTTGTSVPISPKDYNCQFPMWIGNRIYFVHDRLGSFNLAYYDRATRRTQDLTDYRSSGITFAASDGTSIVYARDGRLFTFDPAEAAPRELSFTIDDRDLGPILDERAPRKASAARFVQSFNLSPDGKLVVGEVRGEAILKPLSGGPATNHTNSPAAADREPTISPDGRWLAAFCDESGEYELHLRSLSDGSVRKYKVEPKPSYYTEPFWSPDSRTLAFSDQRLGLWTFDAATGACTRIDNSTHIAQRNWSPAWSPDSRYLAYAKALPNRHRAIVVWDRATGQKTQLTDGFSHAEFPTFDASGRYLYFTGSANARNASAADIGWALLSDYLAQPMVLKRIYAAVLHANDASPVLPYSGRPNPLASFEPRSGPVSWETARRRIVELSPQQRDITGLFATAAGNLLVLVNEWSPAPGTMESTGRLYALDVRKPTEFVKVADPANAVAISADRSAAAVSGAGGALKVLSSANPTGEATGIDLALDQIDVDPRREWRQLYRESWRMMRDIFYDPNHHGRDILALEKHYEAYLPGITRRAELNTLLRLAFGEVSISHLRVGGGDVSGGIRSLPIQTGMLGADWKIENGRYRIEKVLLSGHFLDARPLSKAPLDQPGIGVRKGDYLIEIEGQNVTSEKNLYAYLRGRSNRPTKVKFSTYPDGSGAREYTVVPTPGENTLRLSNWIEENRKWVEEKSDGKLAYVHLSGYNPDGFDAAFRTLNGLRPGQGLIWDQRFNGGGVTSDALIDALRRQPMLGYLYRYGDPYDVPAHRLDGPVVLIANYANGSAAETFASMFKAMKVGSIVGTQTYGGGIGTALTQQTLIDGGQIGIPNRAGHNPLVGTWEIENEGVRPDIEIDITTADFVAGRDSQLEKAVELALKQLAGWKVRELKRPKYPIHPPGG